MEITVGSRWENISANKLYVGKSIVVTSLPAGAAGGRIKYKYECDGECCDRSPASFLETFAPLAAHDFSNPYLCPPHMRVCVRCLQMGPKDSPPPDTCEPKMDDQRPVQEIIGEAQAVSQGAVNEVRAEMRERAARRARALADRFEPMRSGLGGAIVGRWPW